MLVQCWRFASLGPRPNPFRPGFLAHPCPARYGPRVGLVSNELYDRHMRGALLVAILVLILPSWSGGRSGPGGMIRGHVYSWACGDVFEPAACNIAIPDLRLRFDGSDTFYEATTSRNGAYSVSLPAGTYQVEHVWAHTDAANRPILMQAPPDAGSIRITVAPGVDVVADFAWRAGSRP
jgi:hypothetical protein